MIEGLAFYLFASLTVASAVVVISARNPVHSVLFLILAFFNAAGLFVLLGAEFLAMILVIVYVGAVAVLFMFVVMMLDINFVELRQGFLQYLPLGGLIGLVLVAELLTILGAWIINPEAPAAAAAPMPKSDVTTNTHAPGRTDLHPLRLSVPGGGPGAAGCHDRRHRAHPSPPAGRPQAAHRRPTGAPGRGNGHRQEGRVGEGHLMFEIGLSHYLSVAAMVFGLGIFGIFLNRKNVIVILMSIELMLLAVNINLVAFSAELNDLVGQVFAMFVLTVAAAEAAVGLAIMVVYFRNRGSIAVEDINLMKG